MSARAITSLLVLLVVAIVSCTPAKPPAAETNLDQGWGAAKQAEWYWTSQGSRLLPLSWFEALEQKDSATLFSDRAHLESFGYVFADEATAPSRPIGFAADTQADDAFTFSKLRWKPNQTNKEPWLGLTCAACHTGELAYKGTKIRVDGGATLADFQSFIEALNAALEATKTSDEKFARFAKRVLGENASAGDAANLKTVLTSLVEWQTQLAVMNQSTLRYGFGRLDAFGHIYNKAARLVGGPQATGNTPDAPVSYPFLWNVPQLDKVQWNGIAENTGISLPGGEFELNALGRNTGEVIGVFADVKPEAGVSLAGYKSSVRAKNLDKLEQLLKSLRPPRWPDALFGVPKAELVAEGKTLFVTARCANCHEPLDRTNLTREIKTTNVRLVKMGQEPAIGTDPWMACNAYSYEAKAGVLTGTPAGYLPTKPPLPAKAKLADLLGTLVSGSLVGRKGEVVGIAAKAFFGVKPPPIVSLPHIVGAPDTRRPGQLAQCLIDASKVGILGYQSRPLTGIWATAPYLHNGSAPTLYDVLLPPAQRPKSFFVGGREFDPDNVGFVQPVGPSTLFEFKTQDAQGATIEGNSNGGHDYGNATLTEQQRRALVEYMKTL